MAKNRKNQSAAIRFGPALKAVGLCLLLGGAAVGYVWQRSQIDLLGRKMTALELKLGQLRDQNKKLRDQMAILQSPARLQEKVQQLNLGLVPPSPRDVWRVAEPTVTPTLVPAGESDRAPLRQLASR